MKIEYDVPIDAPIGLAEFIDIADRTWDADRPASVWELRHALAALARNRDALFGAISDVTAGIVADRQRSNGSSYFIIHDGGRYSIRLTLWFPEHENLSLRGMEGILFAYDYPHNHNFDLLTTTCFGPGYLTELFDIAAPPWGLMNGDAVAARHTGTFQLEPGAVLLYESCTDVHLQVPVSELSVALNFLPYSSKVVTEPQYAFGVVDDETLVVVGSPQDLGTRELHGARILAKLAASGVALSPEIRSILEGRRGSLLSTYLESLLALDPPSLQSRLAGEMEAGQYATQYGAAAAQAKRWRLERAGA